MKACSLCQQIKPDTSFGANVRSSDGLRSRCKTCDRDSTKEYHARYPSQRQTVKELNRYYANPAAYAEAVCQHIATYIERAIQRFETKTGKEAAPQLTAIRDLAKQVIKEELPLIEPTQRPCERCDRPFTPNSGNHIYCSTLCASADARDRELQRKPPRQSAHQRALATLTALLAEPKGCLICHKPLVRPDAKVCRGRCHNRYRYLKRLAANPNHNREKMRRRTASTLQRNAKR